MPQLQPLVLTDRAATPVNHTFTPRNISGGVGEVVETTGVPVGESSVTVSLRKTGTGRYKGTLKFKVPVVQNEIVNGVTQPVVVRTAYASLDVDFAAGSTRDERNNLVGMIASALAPAKLLVNDTLVELQGVY